MPATLQSPDCCQFSSGKSSYQKSGYREVDRQWKGAIPEMDFEYLISLHDKHNHYPHLAPEKVAVA